MNRQHQTILQRLTSRAGIALVALSASTTAALAVEPADYVRDIKPLLAEKCFACHSGLKQEASLRLDAIGLIRQGGDSGAIITPGKVQESLLVERVASSDSDLRMPPPEAGHPLTDEQVSLLRSWIEAGAPAPEEAIPADPRSHWSFQPLIKPAVPNVAAPWVRNEIDRFLAAEHQRMGLVAAEAATPSLLLRRVYLDLIGLPPTPLELQTFLADQSPRAWEDAVDRLLESPRYGERWARHFMDIWRYSDPSGYGNEIRDGRQHTWRWRDWIIESLNADKPYDQMVVEMLAADEAAPGDLEALRATGFLARNWYKFNRNVWLDNIVEHSSKAFLGLTMNCARCHDHKYDPVGHHEYYQLRAFFEPHDVRDDPLGLNGSEMLVRTFDAKADTPTFPFLQGDENRPDKTHPLRPAVPTVLGGDLAIEPIELPVVAYYPSLRPATLQASLDHAAAEVQAAKAALKAAEDAVAALDSAAEQQATAREHAVTAASAEPVSQLNSPPLDAVPGDPARTERQPRSPETQAGPSPEALVVDDCSSLDLRKWTVESGQWASQSGRLVQSDGATIQHRLVSTRSLPRDFRARVTLRITGGAMWRSVGLGFDVHGQAMQAIYLSAYAGGSKAQVTLQNESGRWAYPSAGTVAREVRLEQDYVLEIAVRDRLMNVLIDDKLQVAYTLPERHAAGKLSIFTFSAEAQFDDVHVAQLSTDATLAADPTSQTTSNDSPRQAASVMQEAQAAAATASAKLARAEAEHVSLTARSAAERVKYGLADGDAAALSLIAARAARLATIRTHQHQLEEAKLERVKAEALPASDAKRQPAVDGAQKRITSESQQLAAAQKVLENGSAEYPPLGPIHPATSTGRRLALARWMVRRENPLAARVLVNHVWLRHFDAPLIERMFDFGLRSEQPRHVALLDWLATQFMEDGWSLKNLHRRIVLSGAYRMSTRSDAASSATEAANRKLDPDNLALWRMNARRMEAEVARDSLLFLGGSLDVTMGGPPISHDQGQTVLRRSLYFRQDKERQMTFLSLFDGAKVNECYRRKATVAPQQALAMFNSQIAWEQAGKLAARRQNDTDTAFITGLFQNVLCRPASAAEVGECTAFLAAAGDREGARRQLALVLLNHNDFVTVR